MAKTATPTATASNNRAMTKNETYRYMAEKLGVTRKQSAQFFDELAQLAYTQAKKNERGFVLPGLGKLIVAKQGPRTFRNPQTGEPVKKPASKKLKFRLSKQAKDSVLGAKK
jgi:DNA-binding protein HU-beta